MTAGMGSRTSMESIGSNSVPATPHRNPQIPTKRNKRLYDAFGTEWKSSGRPMPKRVLITGGAGFIGSHLTDLLQSDGYAVRILDSLAPQVHPNGERPNHLSKEAELVIADLCDREAVELALHGVDAVIHLAAAVGVGQSMYEIVAYTR